MSSKGLQSPEMQSIKVRGATAFDCGGRCPLIFHVAGEKIVRVEGDDFPDPDRQLRACLRCRALRQWVHHPDRLLHPMKRTGERGEGRFQRISWDEAMDTIAENLLNVREKHGNHSILLAVGGAYEAALHNGARAMARLLSLFGGFTTNYGNISSEGAVWAVLTQYGTVMVGNSREDLLNSRLIILWGWDPARMISGTNTIYHLIKAKEAGARVIAVDPRFTETAATVADQWIPVRPGTDTALMAAMAHVMISEGLHDQAFLDRYTVGFDKYRAYVMGDEDGVAKTPAWAEPITGVPKETIISFAREYATTKPAALMDGLGPARSAVGEQFTRSAMTLCAMTGNVGIPGGSAGGGLMGLPIGHMFRLGGIPVPKNPVEAGGPSVRGSLDLRLRLVRRVHTNSIFDAIMEGKSGGYPADIHFVWFANCNYVNQLGNSNKAHRALQRPDFVVVPELFMTPTARYADVLLPVTSAAERNDISRPWPSGPYYIHLNKAIDPPGECKSDLEIACMLAQRLGIEGFNDKTEEEWIRLFIQNDPETASQIKDYDRFKREGVHRVELERPIVAFEEQIKDPENHPFPTPSGKIEIYSQRVADLNDPSCPPIPKYLDTWESPNDPIAEHYPLQLISPHAKGRVHSTLYNVPWLREADPHRVWIHPRDAQARTIESGDEVEVFNDRGRIVLEAWVTTRIIPGVVCVFEGAWYSPDKKGIDRGGCANTLTRDAYSPGGASALNTALVEVRKVG